MTKPVWLGRHIAAPGPYLMLVLSQKEFDDALRHCGAAIGAEWLGQHANASAHHLRDKAGGLVCVVALGQFSERSPIEVAGLLVHEAVHVWQKYAEDIGEDCPGAEQEAYAIQAISQALMTEFARRTA